MWNATLANLSLMALGSSAPEIFLAVLETVQSLGEEAGELGPSTIVGSAAFNLLVISAISIAAVDDGPKAIADVGVFATTSIWSLFAYVWLFLVLAVISPHQVTIVEAWLTLGFFLILLAMAYGMDRLSAMGAEAASKKEELAEERYKENKAELRAVSRSLQTTTVGISGDDLCLMIAERVKNEHTDKVDQADKERVVQLFCAVLNVEGLQGVSAKQLKEALKPTSMFERFAARRANGLAAGKEFLDLKKEAGQIENVKDIKIVNANAKIGFKCGHYAVTENSGHVKVTIVKKVKEDMHVRVMTVAGTAGEGTEFKKIDQIETIPANAESTDIKVDIIDN